MFPLKKYLQTLHTSRLLTATYKKYVNHMGVYSGSDDPEFVLLFVQGGSKIINVDAPLDNTYWNFGMTMIPYWVSRNVAIGVVDLVENFAKTGMPARFRTTEDRLQLLDQLINSVRDMYPSKRVICMGHSFGGIDAARLAMVDNIALDKVIISNGSWAPTTTNNIIYKGGDIKGFDHTQVKRPTLILHHKQDLTEMCRFAAVEKYVTDDNSILVDSIFPHIGEHGADPGPHFYTGQEYEVIKQVYAWCTGQTYQKLID